MVEGSPLAVPEGLVGRVVSAGRSLSRAQLLTDASAAAGARIVRTGELGVVRGDGRGGLRLNNVATTSSVRAGDEVESAGIDGIYPRGIPIGRVESVARGSHLFLEIRVRPAADFSRLTDVLLLAPVAGGGGVRGRNAECHAVKLRRVALLLAAAAALSFLFGASGHRDAWPVDWFLIAVAAVAREGNFVKAVLTGAAAGLLEDGLTQPLIGFNAFAKSALGYGLALVAVRVILGGSVAVGAALALASLANDAIVALLAALLMQAPIVLGARESLWRAATTGITAAALESAAKFPWRDWWAKRRLRRLR